LQETITGDTLTTSSTIGTSVGKKLSKKLGDSIAVEPILSGVHIPEPVFFCSIEPASLVNEFEI